MKEFKIKHLTIYKSDNSAEKKYRPELSALIIEKFGPGPYSDYEKTRGALTLSYNYFCDKFIQICQSEKSLRFYQFVLSQHEQTIELAFFSNKNHYPDGIKEEYIAVYRRILKWIIEEACNVDLHNDEEHNEAFLIRAKAKLNELVFLGDMIFFDANLFAEQDMIEDVLEINFDNNSQYVFSHKHHYDYIINKIQEAQGIHSIKHVVGDQSINGFKTAIHKCFGIEYDYISTVIAEIHKVNEKKGGQYCPFGWQSLPLSVQSIYGSDPEKASQIFKGLTLDRYNKLRLHDLACKPQTMFRYVYRPITIWKVDGEDFAVIGKNGFTECIIQLVTNAIPWGKAPIEWLENKEFKKYVHQQEDQHDKWLDDEVEIRLQEKQLQYHKNVTKIISASGPVNLVIPEVGEIDFLIISHKFKKIYVADSKHLQGRYDMMTMKNDLSNFTKLKNGYNKQISNKVNWISENLDKFDFHNKVKYGSSTPSIVNYEIEGIFIINTPTFYMYNSDYRIYTVDVFAEVITGQLVDPEFTIVLDEGKDLKSFQIKYPYFKKPDYSFIDS